jgi:pimeloyl-ACP methyl ester carboxylesterase
MLVIRGATSDILSAATLARMAREKPDLQQVTVANRGHAPLLNEPDCLPAIDAFIAQHGRIAGS